MARGQSGSLDLLCTTLSSATPSRFYPGANQKLLPCRLPPPLRCRLHPVSFQNCCDRTASKLVAQIGQCTLDSSISLRVEENAASGSFSLVSVRRFQLRARLGPPWPILSSPLTDP